MATATSGDPLNGALYVNGEWATSLRYKATVDNGQNARVELRFMKGRAEIGAVELAPHAASELLGRRNYAAIGKVTGEVRTAATSAPEHSSSAEGVLRGKELEFRRIDLPGFTPGAEPKVPSGQAASGVRDSLLLARMMYGAYGEGLKVEPGQMPQAQALRLAREDARDFAQIKSHRVRLDAARVIDANAERQSAYKTEFTRLDAAALTQAEALVGRGPGVQSEPAAGPARDERLTPKDVAVGAAHAAQLAQAGGPVAHAAVQAVGIADAARVATDVAQGKEVRALDAASAAASVALTTGLGGPAVQLAAQGVASVSAVDAGRRALNTIDQKAPETAVERPTTPLPPPPPVLPRIRVQGLLADRIDSARDLSDKLGVTADIERLSYEGQIAAQIANTLDARLASVRQAAELNNDASPSATVRSFVRQVRVSLGVPSMDEADYLPWRKEYEARHRMPVTAPEQAAAADAAPALPHVVPKTAPEAAPLDFGDLKLISETTPSAPAAPAMLPPAATAAQSAAAPVNSIEHVSERQLQPESPETAALRRSLLAARSQDPEVAPAAAPAPSASSAPAPPSPAQSALEKEEREERARETIARMTRPELDAYAAARKISAEHAGEVLLAAQQRIEAETDRPSARAYPPLEDRFNIKSHLARRDYEFRDQPGKIAFTERWLSMKSTVDSAAVVKAMVDRAEERGWTALHVKGSAEFERQVWIAATARGIKAVGYEPTEGDRLVMAQERERLNAERGQVHAQGGGTILREATREREMPAWADPARGPQQPEREPAGEAGRGQAQDQVRDAAREAGPRQLSAVPGDGAKPAVREPAVALQLRAFLTERGEPTENVETIVAVAARHLQQPRVHVGKVIQHGQAPFEFDDKNALNYFLKLQTPAGERTIWSVDLKRALDEGRVGTGDSIAIEHRGFRPVTVVVPERDASGQVVGSHDEVVQRNTWYAVGIERLREEALLARATPGPDRGAAGRGTGPAAASAGPAGEAGEAAGNAKPLPARPVQALEEQRQTEPRSIARDAMVWEALEVAFEAGNVPAAQRDRARLKVQKELDARHARGEPVKVGVIDPAAPRQVPRTVQMPQHQREPAHDRSR